MFFSPAIPAWDAVLQRIAVTLPLAALGAVAVRLLALSSRDGAA